ncbi:MAG TPA: phytanoyl-CoA dioxygenase family protein [Baekduia sp.]|nr:phytanoyl-CoA dioxygenase family protein [Baekduia sp.]
MDDLREAWDRDGYVVCRAVAPDDALGAYRRELADARDGLLVRVPGDEHVSLAANLPPGQAAGAIDPYAFSPAARALLLAPEARAWVGADTPLLFDAAEAAAGAAHDGPYRDATFTALADHPETLVTLAVALGPETAGVEVFPGSQRVATTPFSGRYRHFNPERDGEAALRRHHDEIAGGLDGEPEIITLNPGDVLVWSADLVHTPVTGAALVAHLCPSGVRPGWFTYRPERARHAVYADGAAWLASQHYDLVDAIAPERPAGDAEEPQDLQRVQEALREHDEDLAYEPGPPPPPPPQSTPASPGQPPPSRPGGFVDSVRGILGRRGRGGR